MSTRLPHIQNRGIHIAERRSMDNQTSNISRQGHNTAIRSLYDPYASPPDIELAVKHGVITIH